MRGALVLVTITAWVAGIIPADAGSTMSSHVVAWYNEDHPRGCGEHLSSLELICIVPGSSPRMRGALEAGEYIDSPNRIIPADAGSTTAAAMGLTADRDHPRGCGEHLAGGHCS